MYSVPCASNQNSPTPLTACKSLPCHH